MAIIHKNTLRDMMDTIKLVSTHHYEWTKDDFVTKLPPGFMEDSNMTAKQDAADAKLHKDDEKVDLQKVVDDSTPPNARPARVDPNAPDQSVKPVGQEQLERSENMIREFGSPHRYMESLDTRDPNDRPRSVPGVGFTTAPDDHVSPSLYPDNWETMTKAEKTAWEADHKPADPPKKGARNG
jgi:hypothetical protein